MHRLGRWHPAYERLLPMLLAWDEPDIPRNWFCDDRTAPMLVLVIVRNRLIMFSGGGDVTQALHDLLAGNLDPPDSWPDAAAIKQWDADGSPRHRVALTAHGLHAYEAALSLGFTDVSEEQDKLGAYYLEISGKPRFASLIKHPCRVVDRGLELLELMKQAAEYDKSGEYTVLCLEHGPSFVCEVDGEPVCWSCTHVNGMMGMIYTPKKLRRRGYARSLAAFQTDYMLRHHGLAACFVLAHNEPSLRMMAAFGARRMKPPMYWRTLEWPDSSS